MSADVGLKNSETPPGAPDSFADAANLSKKVKSSVMDAGKAAVEQGSKISLPSSSSSLKESLTELQDWDQPVQSLAVVCGATLLFYLCSGDDGYSVLSLICVTLMLRLGIVAGLERVIHSISKSDKPEEKEKYKKASEALAKVLSGVEKMLVIPDAGQSKKLIRGFSELIESRVGKVCKALEKATEASEEGAKTFRSVMVHLVGIWIASKLFSTWTLLYLYVMYQMIWPPLYKRNQEKVDQAAAKAWTYAEPHVEKAKKKGNEVLMILADKALEVAKVAGAKANAVLEKLVDKYHQRFPVHAKQDKTE